MDRRETIKTLMIGSVGAGLLLSGCITEEEKTDPEKLAEHLADKKTGYGRTPEEAARDERLKSQTFFSEHEMETIAVLSDFIIPADKEFGSATDADVPKFIEFIVKDIPSHQTPLRGGLHWLDYNSNQLYTKDFIACSLEQKIELIEEIAYPDFVKPAYRQGAVFFDRLRDLVTTGYFTSKIGLDCLGYVGNTPNLWDGVPDEVLRDHGMEYDKKMLGKYIDQTKRNEVMDWEAYKKEHRLS